MCGLFGLHFKDATPTQNWWEQTLTRANQNLAHRGPDEQKYYIDASRSFGVAHQRLAILDLSAAGRQPMLSQSGKSLIVFNGEIYNHLELKKSFPNFSWRGHSDTEVLLEGLERDGAEFIDKLDGMFAFAFYDLQKKELLLATDPAGKKPLYTYWDGDIFAVSSELKAFFDISELRLEKNSEAIKEYLTFGYVPSPQTIYRFVRRLPAGSFQKIRHFYQPQKVTVYWDLPRDSAVVGDSYSQAKEKVRYLLSAAVNKRLVADVPIGCFLSGGLDSSVVSLLAAEKMAPQKLQTFSAVFRGDVPAHYDESVFARFVAERIHSNHLEIPIDLNNIPYKKIITHFGEPFADSSALPTYLLAEQTAKHVKVALSGDGGDELFGGYMRFRAGLMSEAFGWLLRPLLSPLHFVNPPRRSWKGFISRFQQRIEQSCLVQQLAWNSYFDETDYKKFLNQSAENIFLQAREFENRVKDLNTGQKILYYNFKTYLFDDLLPKVDRMSMAHGLEVRSPFLDKSLIEYSFRLPTSYKFTFGETKKILKDIFREDFGSKFVDRKKQGFALPIERFIESQIETGSLPKIRQEISNFHWNKVEATKLIQENSHHKIHLLLSLEMNL